QFGQVTDAGIGLRHEGEIAGFGQPPGDVLDVFMGTPDLRNDEDSGELSSTLRGREVNGDRSAITARGFGVSDFQAVGRSHDHGLGTNGSNGKRNASRGGGNDEFPAGLMRIGWSVHIEPGVFISVAAISILNSRRS